MYSKVQVFFDSSEAALLSVGLLDEYGSVDNLKLAAAKDNDLLAFADLAVDIQRQLQSSVDDFKYLVSNNLQMPSSPTVAKSYLLSEKFISYASEL